jgi:hypothetical protein
VANRNKPAGSRLPDFCLPGFSRHFVCHRLQSVDSASDITAKRQCLQAAPAFLSTTD